MECPLLRPHPSWRQRSGGLTVGRPDAEYHLPVMTERVVAHVEPIAPVLALDATFGGGGHSRALLEAIPELRIVAIDRDPDARARAVALGDRVRLHQADFRTMDRVLTEEKIDEIDAAILDLGVSSHQLDVGDRGFSYRRSGPLDMRMGPDALRTAAEIVNDWPEGDIAGVLRRFGEEPHAGRIAHRIVANRPFADTLRLAGVVADAVPARSRRARHPARRTFQALRIAVNDELDALTDGLELALRMLRPGGRIVVISYHSLEDRIVKRRLAAGARGCSCPPEFPVCVCGATAELRLLTRKVERPSDDEIDGNPRSRSARLRAAEKAA